MTRLLIAYDGSPSAATAVRAAASLFPGGQASVVTMRSEPTVPVHAAISASATQEVLDALRAEARREADETSQQGVEQARTLGLAAEAVAVDPFPPAWRALLDTARGADADVLICGTRGRGGFARALLGSTSSSLLHHADLPLLVVPDGGGALDGPVVAAYDGSDAARAAILTAGRLVSGRAMVVVHAWEPTFHRSLKARAHATGMIDEVRGIVGDLQAAEADDARAITEDGLAAARAAGVDAEGETLESDEGAWRAVAAAARGHGAAMVAVGSRGLGATRSALLGSVSGGLVQNAELPVLVVPATAADSQPRTP